MAGPEEGVALNSKRGDERSSNRSKDFMSLLFGREDQILGPRRRRLVLIAIAIGFVTFFLQLISIDPPVRGKTQWSLFDICWRISERGLPPIDPVSLPFSLSVVYVLLVSAGVAVCVSGLHRRIPLIALTAAFMATESWNWDKSSFEEICYRDRPYHNLSVAGHVAFGQLILFLLIVTGALVFISTNEDLDAAPSAPRAEISDASRAPSEPEFLDAEVLSTDDEDELDGRRSEDRRLHE